MLDSMQSSHAPEGLSHQGRARSTPSNHDPFDDTNPLRLKVRQWQEEVGGVVNAPYVESTGNAPSPTKSSPRIVRDRLMRPPIRARQRKAVTPKVKSSSTPKKRVVSDEHWRKDLNIKHSTPNKASAAKQTDVVERYLQSLPSDVGIDEIRQSTSEGTSTRSPASERNKREFCPKNESRKREPNRSNDMHTNPDQESQDVRERQLEKRLGPRRSIKPNQNRFPGDRAQLNISGKLRDSDFARDPGAASDSLSSENGPGNFWTRKSNNPIHIGIPFSSAGLFSKKKLADSNSTPPTAEFSHPSSVEAWLSSTSDPFVESGNRSGDIPPSSGSRSRKSAWSDTDGTSESDNPKRRSNTKQQLPKDPQYNESLQSTILSAEPQENTTTVVSEETALTAESKEISGSAAKSPDVKQSPEYACNRKISLLEESLEEALHASNGHSSSDSSEVESIDLPPPLALRRPFPSTGAHRLSTILSVETESTAAETEESNRQTTSDPKISIPDSEHKREGEFLHEDTNCLSRPEDGGDMKRRLTKSADLISALSFPGDDAHSVRSRRSIRTNRTRLASATITDIMQELIADEAKYMRELRTLVDGVIPVLLTSILSKSDSVVAAGFFGPSIDPSDQENFIKPIVSMGMSLKRLKSCHKRIPLQDADSLLLWAEGAAKAYRDYLAAWRLGFQDVVVNLAPPEKDNGSKSRNSDTGSLCDGMDQDDDGDVIDGDGEKVDVAYLLKRPLVRLKYLSKTFRAIDHKRSSIESQVVFAMYRDLVADARRRSNEERARLEDNAAAAIDPTRARSLKTLGVMDDVRVDKARRVRARDPFSLSLLHSSGQQIDCGIELLLRDNPPDKGPGGDLLICEVDEADRWLLFPPIDKGRISARHGEKNDGIVVMVRGVPGEESDWKELITLYSDDQQACQDWVHMLGLSPFPPKINRSLSFVNRSKARSKHNSATKQPHSLPTVIEHSIPEPTAIDVPIGETSLDTTARRSQVSYSDNNHSHSKNSEPRSTPTKTPLHRANAKRRSQRPDMSCLLSPNRPSLERTREESLAENDDAADSGPMPSTPTRTHRHSPQNSTSYPTPESESVKAIDKCSLSPVPSRNLPIVPKVRKSSNLSSSTTSSYSDDSVSSPPQNKDTEISPSEKISDIAEPLAEDESPPPPPPHKSKNSMNSPPPLVQQTALRPQKRHMSSPLKHQYEPSTASESSESDALTITGTQDDSSSETESSDEDLDDNIVTPDPPVPIHPATDNPPSASLNAPEATVGPSSSASQAPYKAVPSQPNKSSTSVASMFIWHDKGSWESLHGDECHIVIIPGLIEAYDKADIPKLMELAGANEPAHDCVQPLLALELTPLVPIRRGTAVDISIRSPPTPISKLHVTGNNVMFRAPNAEECDKLYGFINYSRINNPTYVALQNARGPYFMQSEGLNRKESTRSKKGLLKWGLGRRNSYRASSVNRPSSIAPSDSSVGTMATAFSALKNFGRGNKMFNIARSTITSRTGGSGNGSVYSDSTSGSPYNAAMASIGLTNAKIRLYCRESLTKWSDMGSARLTILPATPPPPAATSASRPGTGNSINDPSKMPARPGSSAGESQSFLTPPRARPAPVSLKQEKRIVVTAKETGAILIDACLDERCFERVARTGIAVSVWEDGGIPKEGGVVGGNIKVYMIQMKNEAEAAYTFGLVGKLRY